MEADLMLGALLIELGAAGVALRVRAGTLDARGAAAYATRLRQNRVALLGVLAGYVPAGAEGAYVLAERLGVADSLGMPAHPGAPAWLVAVGEAMQADARDAGAAPEAPRPAGTLGTGQVSHLSGGDVGPDGPALTVTSARLDAWEATAAGRLGRRKRVATASWGAEDGWAFIDQAWRRVRRLEAMGVERARAIDAVLGAMTGAVRPAGVFQTGQVSRFFRW